MDSSKSVLEADLPVNDHFGIQEGQVIDLVTEKKVVKVVNTYFSIPVSSFEARKIEQVQV